VFSLAPTPPANAFVTAAERDKDQERFPLDVHFCESCTHVQLRDVVDPTMLFGNYVYVSGTSPSFVRHFKDYAAEVTGLVGSLESSLVVDIGSNDGTLLRAFKSHGAAVLGVDPAVNLAEAATASGIETFGQFFTPALAERIASAHGRAKVITANNVLAHIDDLDAVIDGIRRLLAPEGVFVFEVSYLLDVIEKVLFDTIYHEHLSYHAVRPLIPFLERHRFDLIETIRVPSHGGSLRAVAQSSGGRRPRGSSVAEFLRLEEGARLHEVATYVQFADRIRELGAKLRGLLEKLKAQGKRIAGYGAPAKATTLMYQFGLDPRLLEYIVDDSPLKQGTFTPGLHVPIVSAEAIQQSRPDYLVILAWNFAEPVIENNQSYLDSGGHFIVPIPEIKVV
jgi:SAM-dependent methyltransferase